MSMDSVQFYYPPSEKSSHTNQRRQRDWQHKSFGAVPALAHFTPEARDCNCVLAYNVDNLGDHLLPPEEVFQTCFPTKVDSAKTLKTEHKHQHGEEPAPDVTGTSIDHAILGLGSRPGASQSQPVIIGDNETDSTDAEIEAETTTSAHFKSTEGDPTLHRISSAQNLTSDLSFSSDISAPSVQNELADSCYIDENKLLAYLELREPSFPPNRPALDNSHSLHYPLPFADKIDQDERDRNARPSSTVPEARAASEPLKRSGGGWNNIAVAKLQKKVDLIYKDRGRLSVASLSYPPHSPRRSIELSPQPNRTPEERRVTSRLNSHISNISKERLIYQDEAALTGPLKETKQREDGGKGEEKEEMTAVVKRRKAERQQEGEDELEKIAIKEPEEGEGEDTVDNSKDEDYIHDTDKGDVEVEEDLQPAKWKNLRTASAKEALKLTYEQHLQRRRRSSSKYMQIEIEDSQSRTEDLRFAEDKRRDTLAPSRSPSAAAESEPAAEYEEWPLHGFLKRTRIGGTMMFNLEFHLTHVPKHLEKSGLSERLRSSITTLAQRQTSHSDIAHSNTLDVNLRHSRKRILWTKAEDETLVKMKEEGGCSWEEISTTIPSRTAGAIQVRYSIKFSGSTVLRKRRRL